VSAAEAAEALRSSVRGGVTVDAPLAPFTSFRIGGPAAILVEAFDEPDLLATASVAASSGLPILSLGRGSNVLVSDRGYPGIVVRLGKGFEWITDGEDGLEAGSATPLPRLANRAAGRGLRGLEFAVAIPASLGGAVRMNAGAQIPRWPTCSTGCACTVWGSQPPPSSPPRSWACGTGRPTSTTTTSSVRPASP
jgi:UDP-N-acetylmuramate dehydrogenase